MITYNHENFIREAIEGVLMQKTTFPIELIIGEDCSTDKTRKIVVEYFEKYPAIVKPQLPHKNRGMQNNFISIFKATQGKYIAMCEGDDYWADPYKLQKQVDFLEANEEYSICFHPVKVWKENEKTMVDDVITREVPETTTILDLAEGNYIHTPSVVFRKNEEVLDVFENMGSLPVGDYVLHMLNAKYGKIKKLPEVMGVYRVHDGGVWSDNKDIEYKFSSWLSLLNELLIYFKEDKLIVNNFKEQYGCIAYTLYDYFKGKDEYKADKYLVLAIENNVKYVVSNIKKSEKEINLLADKLRSITNSRAYKLGKFILKPFSFFRHKIFRK